MTVNEIRRMQKQYIENQGVFTNITEVIKVMKKNLADKGESSSKTNANDTYNNLNRELIVAYAAEHENVFLSRINYYDKERDRVIDGGTESIYVKYAGQQVNDYEYTFIVPMPDLELESMIREWNMPHTAQDVEMIKRIKEITQRIDDIGGISLSWF